MSLVTVVRLDG